MGIDVYMRWNGQTEAERKAQYTGYSVEHGHVGYLREAYHGGPYVTRWLVGEAFESDHEDGEPFPAAKLRERLPVAVLMANYRDHVVYGEGERGIIEGGVDQLPRVLDRIFSDIKQMRSGAEEAAIAGLCTPAVVEQAKALIAGGRLNRRAKAFVDFVELAERKERETGAPVRVYVSA